MIPVIRRCHASPGPRLLGFILLLAGLAPGLTAAPTAPDWVRSAAQSPATFDYGKASAVVLLSDTRITVGLDGLKTVHTRCVIRILSKEGSNHAWAAVAYDAGSDRVKSLQAWLLPATGPVKLYGKKETGDMAAFSSAKELYSQSRKTFISARNDVTDTGVFAYEAVTETRSNAAYLTRYFSDDIPTELTRFTVTVPAGWRMEPHVFNHETLVATVAGNSATWELRQLPGNEPEPLSPPTASVLPRLAVDLVPPPGAKTLLQQHATWRDIATFFQAHYDSASTPTTDITAKAAALAANSGSAQERIYALCRFAQNVNYISISLNLGMNGGYIPRPAPKVLQSNYGDCKDKVTLLRSLLRAEGIESFPLILYSGDSHHVRPEWPSPSQFNHVILAIRVDDACTAPAIVTHPEFGRLLVFDPTNPYCPPGWLPEEDAGGHALLLAGAAEPLIALPSMRPDDHRITRTISAQLYANGAIVGILRQELLGQPATEERARQLTLSPEDYQKGNLDWLQPGMPLAEIGAPQSQDRFDQAGFSKAIPFATRGHGKVMRDTLLVFRPVLISRMGDTSLKKGKRTKPISLPALSFTEHTRFVLPAGFRVEELPPPMAIKADFGTYTATIKPDGDSHLLMERTMQTHESRIPASDYERVLGFYEKVLASERSPVVLRKTDSQ